MIWGGYLKKLIVLRRTFPEIMILREIFVRRMFLKERLLGIFSHKWWAVWVDILIADKDYLISNSYLFQGSIPTFFNLISIKLIPWFSINWCIWSGNINYRIVSPRIMYDWRVVWQSCFPYFQHLSITKNGYCLFLSILPVIRFWLISWTMYGKRRPHAQIPSRTNKTHKWP